MMLENVFLKLLSHVRCTSLLHRHSNNWLQQSIYINHNTSTILVGCQSSHNINKKLVQICSVLGRGFNNPCICSRQTLDLPQVLQLRTNLRTSWVKPDHVYSCKRKSLVPSGPRCPLNSESWMSKLNRVRSGSYAGIHIRPCQCNRCAASTQHPLIIISKPYSFPDLLLPSVTTFRIFQYAWSAAYHSVTISDSTKGYVGRGLSWWSSHQFIT